MGRNPKSFTAEIKLGDEVGRGLAVFSTLNTVDLDHDVTLPGAFGSQKAKLAQAHRWDAPNIGMAEIREVGNEALADMKFYLDMPEAQSWYSALKNNFENGVPQEFSYGFTVLDSSFGEFDGQQVRFLKDLKVLEISPVMRGAGIDTRLLDMKSEQMTLEQQFEYVEASLAEAAIFLDREKALAALRGKEGRVLSRANRTRLGSMSGRLQELMTEAGKLRADIDTLLRETDPDSADPEKTANLFAQYQRTLARIGGHIV